jgi:hypothetical protein
MIELHFEDGWRDEVLPDYNPELQYLGDRFYDIENDVVIFVVVDIIIDLEAEKNRWFADLAALRREIGSIITDIRLLFDPEPELLTHLVPSIKDMYLFAKDEIAALTLDNVKSYVLRGSQVEQLLFTLNSLL